MKRICRYATFLVLSVAATAVYSDELNIDDDTFHCIRDMTPVRGFFVDNLIGDIDETLAVANAGDGKYPEGSVIQLVPTEVMVKHAQGFNSATNDWEFIELDVSDTGSSIRVQGFVDVVNRFGGNCFACHVKANPGRDMICEQGHGCDPIPLTPTMIKAIQNTDPRCEPLELPAEQVQALEQLKTAIAQP